MQMTDVEKERCKLAEHIVTEHTVEPTFKPRHQVGVRVLRSTTCFTQIGADDFICRACDHSASFCRRSLIAISVNYGTCAMVFARSTAANGLLFLCSSEVKLSLLEPLLILTDLSRSFTMECLLPDDADVSSLVGVTRRRRHVIDTWRWGRAALSFTEMSFAEFDFLVRHLGQGLAGEVLLLSISKKCGTDMRKWETARKFGIPWLVKRWSSCLAMERSYNHVVYIFANQ